MTYSVEFSLDAAAELVRMAGVVGSRSASTAAVNRPRGFLGYP
ncbi:MAG: hypothetical protein ACKOBP_11205 [Planctomycetia bacterium]